MSAAKLRSLMEKQGVEPEVVRLINAMVKNIGFTETLFVSTAGDNSDGSSWNRAYTALKTALDWIEDNQETGEVHVIILGDGSWDLETTGVPTYTKNIAIYGIDSRHQAVISNSHASATGIFKFTGWCSINNVCFDCGTGETGININGTSAIGSRLRNLCFDCASLAAGNDAILLDGGVSFVYISDIHIDGEITNTAAIRFNDAFDCIIQNIIIHNALVGLQSDHADDDNNIFEHCHINDCITGIQIAAGGATNNHFEEIFFHGCTTRISDSGTTSSFTNLHLAAPVASVSPADLTGQVIAAGAGANNWSAAAVQIRAAGGKPFYITGLVYEGDTLEKWGIRLFTDGGTSPVWDGILEAAANRSNRLVFVEKFFCNQGIAIHGTVKSETGGNNMDLWLNIVEV